VEFMAVNDNLCIFECTIRVLEDVSTVKFYIHNLLLLLFLLVMLDVFMWPSHPI
jgi:hypothetical protein